MGCLLVSACLFPAHSFVLRHGLAGASRQQASRNGAVAGMRPSRPVMMAAETPSVVGVGVIGCGRIGQIHSNTVAFRTPGARLVAITDPFEEMGKKVGPSMATLPRYPEGSS